jgi:hypothetical protein
MSVGRLWIWVALIGCLGVLAAVALPVIWPMISFPPVTADLAAPPQVKAILRNSCYDCHSNETRLAWFDRIAPVYWLVARDVNQGRAHLNFSQIGAQPIAVQRGALFEGVSQIQAGDMPPADYTRIHRDSAVTDGQVRVLRDYLSSTVAPAVTSPGEAAADRAQYDKWIHDSGVRRAVAPAPNGIEFLPDYKNWRLISATDRFDNQSMRVILGNDTAVQAVGKQQTNPWPDGTAFAKVAWFARDDGSGNVRPGAFIQVEFMIRDSSRYAVTHGWGWARWRGDDLRPYRKDAGFSSECIGCHTPVRGRDYVFTSPAAHPTLKSNALEWRVISPVIDKRTSTIGVLFGNDVAVQHARTDAGADYPGGSETCLVKWEAQEDRFWFGANIPARVRTVECASVRVDVGTRTTDFESYAGAPLTKAAEGNVARAAYLFSIRPAVMP